MHERATFFSTRPWNRAEATTASAAPVRFTASQDGDTVYALVPGPLPASEITIIDFVESPSEVRLLGVPQPLSWTRTGDFLFKSTRMTAARRVCGHPISARRKRGSFWRRNPTA